MRRGLAVGPASTIAGSEPLLRDPSTLGLIAVHVRRLGDYVPYGARPAREVLAVTRPDESILVLDALAGTLADARLIAHLHPDEPAENARIVSEMYLADESRGRCRLLSSEDPQSADRPGPAASIDGLHAESTPVLDSRGRAYLIREVLPRDSRFELRWTRTPGPNGDETFEILTLRDVLGALEDYEPARAITLRALAVEGRDTRVSTQRLGAEAQRLACSPIVLNRRLRETVQRTVADGITMSEIAIRCGRTKRDRSGSRSGETTWLARRIGQMPEGGEAEPTPWVHINTLALIARDGLGLCPNEVEL
jgi:hypothetical protein